MDKSLTSRLVLCVATLHPDRCARTIEQWRSTATYDWPIIQTTGVMGVVPAYAKLVGDALAFGGEILACLHDDVEIYEKGWDKNILDFFDTHPRCGLAGFGGATGLGAPDIYQTPYNPMQLARRDFCSNMRDAESHGRRVVEPLRCAAFDGFAQVGRAEFWGGLAPSVRMNRTPASISHAHPNLFQQMADWGLIFHAYDSLLGCFAKRLGWEAWLLPFDCKHHGGLTSVGDKNYETWAKETNGVGDQKFWEEAHQIGYREFRDVLPFSVASDGDQK